MSTLNEFISTIKTTGLMPANRYKVNFIPPVMVRADLQLLTLFCDSVALPGMTISTQQARSYGEIREIPYERIFDNINLSFYVDTSMGVKKIFDDWVNQIQNPLTRQIGWYNDYITDMTITVQDKSDGDVYSVTLYECYPKTIQQVTLDYTSKDVMKLSVSMNYKYWIANTEEKV